MNTENNTMILPSRQEGSPMLAVFTRQGHQMDYALGDKVIMGRMGENPEIDLPIPSYLVSRKHGEFGLVGDYIFYRDLGSSNGSRINGKLCQDSIMIEADDILTVSPRHSEQIYADCLILTLRCPQGKHYQWTEIELKDEIHEIVIGRDSSDEMMSSDLYLSRKHASFYRSSTGWKILDLDSTNGLTLNHEKVNGYADLQVMDLLHIGSGYFLYLEDRLIAGWPVEDKMETTEEEQSAGERLQNIPQNNDVKTDNDALVIDIIEKNVWNRMKKKTLLRDINMTIHPGEMVLILGGSGAGKTTFMNAVIGYESAEGSVSYGDLDVFKEYEQIKYQIGYVPQQDLVRMQDSVYDTIYAAAQMKMPYGSSKEEIAERVDWAIELMGLSKEKKTMAVKLSGGQRKRMSIAIELVGDPALLFLDEPDSGLDGIMARTLMENLRSIANLGKIVMVISHGPDRAADLWDNVMVLAKSTIDQCGHLTYYGSTKDAYDYFQVENLEGIVRKINRVDEGGEGMADTFIERWEKRSKMNND